MNTSLYSTTIIHKRFSNIKHSFKYFIFSLFIDCDELSILSRKILLFSYNKFNIFSYYEKDHGYRDGRSLQNYVSDKLKSYKIESNNLKIKIFCFPRILGYVFNPLSMIYCYRDNQLFGIFYEVKNTSNEQHTYLFASNNVANKDLKYKHQCYKNFYVSPFIGMKGLYKFKNSEPKKKMSIIIDLFDENNNKVLTALQLGYKIDLSSLTLIKQLLFNPILSFKVIFAIIYESIFIHFKGGKYYAREKKIIDTISYEGKL